MKVSLSSKTCTGGCCFLQCNRDGRKENCCHLGTSLFHTYFVYSHLSLWLFSYENNFNPEQKNIIQLRKQALFFFSLKYLCSVGNARELNFK